MSARPATSLHLSGSVVLIMVLGTAHFYDGRRQAAEGQEKIDALTAQVAALKAPTEACAASVVRQGELMDALNRLLESLRTALVGAPQAARHHELIDIQSLGAEDIAAFDAAQARGCVVEAIGLSRAGLGATWNALLLCQDRAAP